jgi:hypothetical protein
MFVDTSVTCDLQEHAEGCWIAPHGGTLASDRSVGRTFASWLTEGGWMARFHVAALVHYTVERPDSWTTDQEAELVKTTTMIGQYAIDDVEVTYFEPSEAEGGEG